MEEKPSKPAKPPSPRGPRRWTWKTWLAQGLAAAFVLGAWRYWKTPSDNWHAELKYADYDCSQGEVCRFKPKLSGEVNYQGGRKFQYTTNALGFRGKDYPTKRANPTTIRIAVMGSSPMFGIGVDDDQTFTVALEHALREALPGRSFEVMNFGLPENATASMVTTYRAFARPFEPDVAIFVNARDISPNDMNYRLVQIDRSVILTELLGYDWGRALINDFQSRTHHWYFQSSAEASLRHKLEVLLEDQRSRGLIVVFFNFFDRLDRVRDLLPKDLVRAEIATGMTREAFIASPHAIPRDGHPTADGHRYLAGFLAPQIVPLLAGLPCW